MFQLEHFVLLLLYLQSLYVYENTALAKFMKNRMPSSRGHPSRHPVACLAGAEGTADILGGLLLRYGFEDCSFNPG